MRGRCIVRIATYLELFIYIGVTKELQIYGVLLLRPVLIRQPGSELTGYFEATVFPLGEPSARFMPNRNVPGRSLGTSKEGLEVCACSGPANVIGRLRSRGVSQRFLRSRKE